MTVSIQNKVLIVGNFLSSSGGSRSVCEDLAVRLAYNGWEVLTTSDKPGRLIRGADMVYAAWRLRDRYQIAQIDVFSGKAFLWAEAVCWMLKQAKKRYVLTLHGGNLPQFAKRWPDRVRRLLQSAAGVTTPSHYLQEQMKSYYTGLQLLPNSIDLSNYPYKLRSSTQPQLIWLRAFHHIYNPALAPKVIAHLINEFSDVHLYMVGPDKGDGSLHEMQQAAQQLNVQQRISLPGRVHKKELPQWLNKGDIFLNTTNVDNMPISVLEALACGLCIVSTNVGGIPYLLEHEQDSLLVPPNDPQAMANAVQQILANPMLAEHLSRNARLKAAQFDWSVVLPQWETLLKSVMKGQ